MIVCSCNVISDHEVRDAASNPTTSASMSRIYRTLGRKPRCGRCKSVIRAIVNDTRPTTMTRLEDRLATAQKVEIEFDEVSTGRSGPKHRHWKLEFVEGTILVVLGCAAAFLPFGFGIATFMWLLVIGGLTGLITTLVMWEAPGFWWSLASAILAIGIASIMFAVPVFAVVGLPILMICFLVLEGLVTVMLALEHWRHLSGRWGWMLASGLVDLSLAVFIVAGLPTTASGALGLVLAVNLIFGGGAMIGMALAARG